MGSLLVSEFVIAILMAITIGSLIAISRSSNSSGGGGGGGGGGISQPETVLEKYAATFQASAGQSIWSRPQLGAFVTGKNVSISTPIYWSSSFVIGPNLPLLFNLPFRGSQLVGDFTSVTNLPVISSMELYSETTVAFRVSPGNRLLVGSDILLNPSSDQGLTIYLNYQKD